MVNVRLCEMARPMFVSVRPGHFEVFGLQDGDLFRPQMDLQKIPDCETFETTQKQDCETCESWLKFCETLFLEHLPPLQELEGKA